MGRIVDAKYELVRLVGRGGMGEVHEATHTTTGRRVALKLLRTAGASVDDDTSDIVKRFQREARAAGQIVSPHIVQVLDAGSDAATHEPYMVMEYLVGEDLASVARRLGPLPVELVLRIGAQAAIGLARAHDTGIVHRDVKPANLYLSRTDEELVVKVLDFGVARVTLATPADADTAHDLTQTGTMVGSPHYMSPEQARGLKTIDLRADVWSLGVVLYKLLAGRTPHERGEGGLGDLLVTICCSPPPPLQDLAPWVPPDVAKVVHRALLIEPDRRYPSMIEFHDALSALLPDDHRIGTAMLESLDEEHRAQHAARAEPVSGQGSATSLDAETIDRPDTTLGLAATEGGAPARRRSTVAWVLGLASVVAVAAGVAWEITSHTRPPAAAASAPAPSEPAPPPARTVALTVSAGASVEVDGAPATRSADGTIALTGALGSTHQVRVRLGEVDRDVVVAISEAGPVPSAIRIARAEPRASASHAAPVAPPRAVAPAASAVVKTNKPAPAASKDLFVPSFE